MCCHSAQAPVPSPPPPALVLSLSPGPAPHPTPPSTHFVTHSAPPRPRPRTCAVTQPQARRHTRTVIHSVRRLHLPPSSPRFPPRTHAASQPWHLCCHSAPGPAPATCSHSLCPPPAHLCCHSAGFCRSRRYSSTPAGRTLCQSPRRRPMETVLLLALGLLAQVRHGHLRGSLPPCTAQRCLRVRRPRRPRYYWS